MSKTMCSARIALAALLLSSGGATTQAQEPDEPEASAALAVVPTTPISVDGPASRYFRYGGELLPLIGVSGEYLPQVEIVRPGGGVLSDRDAGLVADYCVYNAVNGVRKFQRCINQLKAAGLNKLRLWVGLNHSPGSPRSCCPAQGACTALPDTTVTTPYTNEQLLPRIGNKWKLDAAQSAYDATYLARLVEVITYARDNGVIVEVTLFDAWQAGTSAHPAPAGAAPACRTRARGRRPTTRWARPSPRPNSSWRRTVPAQTRSRPCSTATSPTRSCAATRSTC